MQMQSQLATLFIAAINYASITPANKSLALWGLGVFLYLDLLNKPQYIWRITSIAWELLILTACLS